MTEGRGGFPQCCQEPTQCGGCDSGLPAVVNLTMAGWSLNSTYDSFSYGPSCLTAGDFNDTFTLPVGYPELLGVGFAQKDICDPLETVTRSCNWADDFPSLVSGCSIGKECRFAFRRSPDVTEPLKCRIELWIKLGNTDIEKVEFEKTLTSGEAADCCNWNLTGWTVTKHERVVGDPDSLMLDSSGVSVTLAADNTTCDDLDPGGCLYYNPGIQKFNVSLDAFHDGPEFSLEAPTGFIDQVVYGTDFTDAGNTEVIDDTASGSIQGDIRRAYEDLLIAGEMYYDLSSLSITNGEEITLLIRYRVANTGNDPEVWWSELGTPPPDTKLTDLPQGATYAANGDTVVNIGGTDYDFKDLGTFNWNSTTQRYLHILSGDDSGDDIYVDAIVVRKGGGGLDREQIGVLNSLTRPTSGATDEYSDGCTYQVDRLWPWEWTEYFVRDCDSGPDPVCRVYVGVRWHFCGNEKFRYFIRVISVYKVHWCWPSPALIETGTTCVDTENMGQYYREMTFTQDTEVDVTGDQSNPIAISFVRPSDLDNAACATLDCNDETWADAVPNNDDDCLYRYAFAVSQLTLTPVMVP